MENKEAAASMGEIMTEGATFEEVYTEVGLVSRVAVAKENRGFLIIGGVLFIIILIVGVIAFLLLKGSNKKKVKKKSKKKRTLDREYLEQTMCPTTPGQIENYGVHVADEAPFRIGKVHSVGKRSGQQDTFGLSDVEDMEQIHQKGMLAVVADGMGGLENGDEISAIATVAMLRYFDEKEFINTSDIELNNMVYVANDNVNTYLGESKLGKCGTTITSVIIKENYLYWISVGDSGIFLYRNNQLVLLNERHNYAADLDEKVRNGEITEEEALGDVQRAALTSFIGAGELSKVSRNDSIFELQSGDRILLMSDGVFGTLSDEEISYLMHFNVNESAYKIQSMIEEKDKNNQDNYTALIIEYLG